MLDFLVYLLYRGAAALLATLPLRTLFAIGNAAGFCAWLGLGRYRRLARRNVATAFAMEKSPRQLGRLVRRHFQRLGANLSCSIKLATMPPDEILRRLTIENIEAVERELRAGVPVVLVLSHLATWELFAPLMPKFVSYVQVSTIFQRPGNRFIDLHLRQLRGRTGLRLFDRKEGFQPVIELLRGGGGVGILSDQHAGDQGLWTPFFGRLASTSPLAGLLAKRTGAAVVAAAVYTAGPARWRMVFTDRFETTGASVEELTLRINEIIEQQIRRAPEDWFWVHNRWKTPQPKFLLARYKRGVYLPGNRSAKDLKPFRILVRSSNWLGDAVLGVPAVRAIKAGRPDAHVTVAAPARIAPMWKLIPEVDEIMALSDKSLFATVRLIRRHPAFDVGILFPNSLRAALEAWLGGIPRRVGYRGRWRSWLLNQIVRELRKPGPIEHQSKRYLRIAHECGADISKIEKSKSQTEKGASHESLKIGLCPGAEYGSAKRWLVERFAETASKISEKHKVQWILFGTAKDVDLGKQISTALDDNCLNRIGQTTLDQLIDELRGCRLLLTNDTGTMHLAALLGIPTIAIFGSTEPRFTGPLGEGHIVLRHQVECSPCFLRECPIDFRCMRAVSAQEVVDAVVSILRK